MISEGKHGFFYDVRSSATRNLLRDLSILFAGLRDVRYIRGTKVLLWSRDFWLCLSCLSVDATERRPLAWRFRSGCRLTEQPQIANIDLIAFNFAAPCDQMRLCFGVVVKGRLGCVRAGRHTFATSRATIGSVILVMSNTRRSNNRCTPKCGRACSSGRRDASAEAGAVRCGVAAAPAPAPPLHRAPPQQAQKSLDEPAIQTRPQLRANL